MYCFGFCIFYAIVGCNLYGNVYSEKTGYAYPIANKPQQTQIPQSNLNAQLAHISAVQMKTLKKLEQIKKTNLLNMERIHKETLAKMNGMQKDERCVVTDATIQCGGFCLSALHPLVDDISYIQKEIDSQKESQANIKIIQKETLEILQEILLKLTAIQKVNEANTPKRQQIESRLIPPGFELIGSRYFNIVTDTKNWADAEVTCRQRGGYLATIQNQEEYDAIKPKLMKNSWYWLGVNDIKEGGQYVSVASGHLAQFFMWNDLHYEPNSFEGEGDCVSMINDEMYDAACEDLKYFICQLDNLV
uniref:CD209 antigen-like protein E n=1 Tax=Drosophila rhopaloa TaxID=1041015 RepID=A0A6P4ES33_DRORH